MFRDKLIIVSRVKPGRARRPKSCLLKPFLSFFLCAVCACRPGALAAVIQIRSEALFYTPQTLKGHAGASRSRHAGCLYI